MSTTTTIVDTVVVDNAETKKAEPSTVKHFDSTGKEYHLPNFTIGEIRNAIPAHCYERDVMRSLSFLLRDLAGMAFTFLVVYKFLTPEYVPSKLHRFLAWNVYAFVQGLWATGVWMLGHDCGHMSFSSNKYINDTVGWFIHSWVGTPYFSWKYSHGKHHKATQHMERDMTFLPRTRATYANQIGAAASKLEDLAEESPLITSIVLLVRQTIGFSLYLMQNNGGHNFHERQPEGRGKGKKNGNFSVNHYDPRSPIFDNKDAKYIALSDLGLGLTALALREVAKVHGWGNVALWWLTPYLWLNNWLAIIVYLHHTDPELPHFQPEAWNFIRGALATIDRDFGWLGRFFFHDIVDYHVIHHFVSTIPHYHNKEATEAIIPIMGPSYKTKKHPGGWGYMIGAPYHYVRDFWDVIRSCQWAEPHEGAKGEQRQLIWYRNRNGWFEGGNQGHKQAKVL